MKNSKVLIIFLGIFFIIGMVFIRQKPKTIKQVVKSNFPVPANAIDEIKLMRTETSRTFVNKDGSYTYVGYEKPVHYKDENGNLQEISTLITPSDLPDYDYAVTTNNIKTYFKQVLNENDYLLIIYDNKKVFQGINKIQDGLGKINFTEAKVNKNQIVYSNIYPGIDLRYTIFQDKVLEEFIVNDKNVLTKIDSFSQKLTLENFNYKNSGGEIVLDNKLILPIPVMYELNNQENKSFELQFKDQRLEGDQFLLKKVLTKNGKSWLTDSTRNLPVVIDATFSEPDTTSDKDLADARSQQGSTTGYVSNEDGILAGQSAGNWTDGFRFESVNIPRGSTISTAYLTLEVHTGGQSPTFSVGPENVDDCGAWSSAAGNAPGSRRGGITGACSWTQYLNGSHASYNSCDFTTGVTTVTSRAGWTSGNHMCVFVDWVSGANVVYFDSQEDGTASYHPVLIVTYTVATPTGLTASDGTDSAQVVLSWNKVTDAPNYNVYYGTDCSSAKTLLTTVGAVGSHKDTSADAPTLGTPTVTATDGTYSNKVTLAVSNDTVTAGTSRGYWVTAVGGSVESGYSNCNTGYRSTTVDSSSYQYDITTNSTGSDYNTITTAGTDPYDWTGCNLSVHYYFRVLYTAGSNTFTSSWSATTGGDEGWCSGTGTTSNIQFNGVKIDGIQVAPP